MDRDIEVLWNDQPDTNADLSTPTTLPPRMEDDPALDLPEPARPSKRRTRTYKPSAPLDSGFMAPSTGGEVTLKQLLNIISSKDAENRDLTILSYWARGSASGGDEAKMKALNIDSNEQFALIVDAQRFFKELFPNDKTGMHSLSEAAHKFDLPYVSQNDLQNMSSLTRARNIYPVKHNAAADAVITLQVTVKLLEMLADLQGCNLEPQLDATLMSLDFEGGGCRGHGTTEIGVAKLRTTTIKNCPLSWADHVSASHAVTEEFLDVFLKAKAEERMGICHYKRDTFPRWNNTTGVNPFVKVYRRSNSKWGHQKIYYMSLDTEVIKFNSLDQWLLQRLSEPAARLPSVEAFDSDDSEGGTL